MKQPAVKRPRGRPATTGKGELIGVRILPDLLEKIDDWRKAQEQDVSRPNAIRRLVQDALDRSVKF